MPVDRERADISLRAAVDRIGEVFAVFDARTQDSGHISYGVRDAAGRRWFVKTPGEDLINSGGLDREGRSRLLELSAQVSNAVEHPALIPVSRIVETVDGPVVVSEWFEGELVRAPAHLRDDPAQVFNRFKALPVDQIVKALDAVIDVHVRLDEVGWVAGDLYDGSLMYDFAAASSGTLADIKVMDFECYHRGPYVNEVGRLPGSTRFMAPEEFTKGALIDSRTTIFTLARMIKIFLLERHPGHPSSEIVRAATSSDPDARPASLAEFQLAWRRAS